jgi:hypothetical protein
MMITIDSCCLTRLQVHVDDTIMLAWQCAITETLLLAKSEDSFCYLSQSGRCYCLLQRLNSKLADARRMVRADAC